MNQLPGRKCLIVVLPYLVKFGSASDKKSKEVRSFLAFPYGALTIASYVNENSVSGSRCELLDLNIYVSQGLSDLEVTSLLLKKVKVFEPDVIGFSMSFDISFAWIRDLSSMLEREVPNIVMVAGGPAVTTGYKELALLLPQVHGFCYSEGELGLLNLLDSPKAPMDSLKEAPWISLQKLEDSSFKPSATYTDLDDVIDVDYQLVDIESYSMREAFSPFTKFQEGSRQFFIVTSRGCPFKCVFCAEPSFHGANMRYASVSKVVDHVTFLVKKYNLTVLTIYDDQLLMNRDRAKEIFRGLVPLNIRIEMPNGVTLSYIDDELAELMSAAGVDTIFLAIEHGSKRVLKDIVQKPIAFDRIKPTIETLQRSGIFVVAFFVFGLPGELPSERIRTRNFILENGIDWSFMNYATPLRGSELFNRAREEHWLDDRYLHFGAIDMTDYVLNVPNITGDKIKREMFLLNLDVNFVNNSSMARGDYKTAIKAFREVIFRHSNQPFAHYYISKCYAELSEPQLAADHFKTFERLVALDSEWYATAELFSLVPIARESFVSV